MLSFTPLLADRGYGDHDGGGFFFFLFLVLVGVGIFFVVRSVRRRRGTWPEQIGGAKRVLDERFARGEIDRAEYEHRKAVLDGADVVPPAPAAPPSAAPPSATPTGAAGTATMAPPAADHAPDPATDPGEPSADSLDETTTPGSEDEPRPDDDVGGR